jgi:3-hydroxy-9,10-secoandrosta-1,3,5(10)-triene-9,17-dione monooxygenase reductase component
VRLGEPLWLDPPLVSLSVVRASIGWPKVCAAGRLCARVLVTGQEPVRRALSNKWSNQFAFIHWFLSGEGSPRITRAQGWINYDITHELDGGDHLIVVARVSGWRPEGAGPSSLRGASGRPPTV